MGLDVLYSKLMEFGFKDIPPNLSIVLGSFGISPLEYSNFIPCLGTMVRLKILKLSDKFRIKPVKPSWI